MCTNGGNAGMRELTDICATFAIIYDHFLDDRIVDSSLDIRDNEDLIAHSLVFFRSSYAGEIDVVVSYAG
jgi:hypothetical protein